MSVVSILDQDVIVITDKKTNEITNEVLERRLERVSIWINNCDTKISFALAFVGILLAGFISSNIFVKESSFFYSIESPLKSSGIWMFSIGIVYLFSVLCFIIFIIIASFVLINALKARINTKKFKDKGLFEKSLIHFQTIAEQNFKDFKKAVDNETTVNKKDDLVSQIYINSTICTKKFELYNIGIINLKISILAFIVINLSAFLLN